MDYEDRIFLEGEGKARRLSCLWKGVQSHPVLSEGLEGKMFYLWEGGLLTTEEAVSGCVRGGQPASRQSSQGWFSLGNSLHVPRNIYCQSHDLGLSW